MRGTNSNHTLVLLNGIPINDQSSPKAMFDFGYDFLQGLQQIEIYKGASGAIFGPQLSVVQLISLQTLIIKIQFV